MMVLLLLKHPIDLAELDLMRVVVEHLELQLAQ
jgi:hypothetical protein